LVLEEACLTPVVLQWQVKEEHHEQSRWGTGHFVQIRNVVQANTQGNQINSPD